MEQKIRVSLTAEIGGYEVDMKTWDDENYLSRIFIKKLECPQLVLLCPIAHSLDYETPTFDYEIEDDILIISHIVNKVNEPEKKKKICQIGTSFIDAFAMAVSTCLNAIPEDLGIVCRVETCNVNGDISGSIDKEWVDDEGWHSQSSTFFIGGGTNKALSTWIRNEYGWKGNQFVCLAGERPNEEPVIKSFTEVVNKMVNNHYAELLRERKKQHDRESYIHTDADKKAYLFCYKMSGETFHYIAVDEDGLKLGDGTNRSYEEGMKSLEAHLYEYHWKYKCVYCEPGDKKLISLLEKLLEDPDEKRTGWVGRALAALQAVPV